ncbi:hypothetical protein CANARDRAFT_26498 [[Candida] arabinofermentans NRRL YB-2248]|uniref:Uncharacterized protein n=1 Tax=[Candida] arabinofermentans NRRL YB-2248 TaxID=983967 RepID=A0A1E4T5P1_9ASCO|nr:hypothetical protein CANARDRAFT_26498 [[Candida] arabinofermentans NRRL YB-2248]
MKTISSNIYNQVNRRLVNTINYQFQPQLFLHLLTDKNTKVSFSKDPDSLPVGYFNAPAQVSLDKYVISPREFKPNSEFISLLQKIVSSNVQNDQNFMIEALNYPSNYMPIYDFKKISDFINQKPELDNVLGYVNVNELGEMVEGTYEQNHMYRLCNSDGMVKLSDYILEKVEEAI